MSDPRPSPPPPLDVAAVIVTYEPELAALARTLTALTGAGCSSVVVDNSESAGMPARVRDECARVGATFLGGVGNSGIAAAQNLGVAEVARRARPDVVLFLDQDSILPETFVERLRGSFRELRALDPDAAVLAALPVDAAGRPLLPRAVEKAGAYLRVDVVISSGSMACVRDVVAAGGFREDLFIDLVDNEFCWRMARQGRRSYVDPRIPFRHRVGTGKTVGALGLTAPVSAPVRGYYQTRNLILLGRSGVLRWPAVAWRLAKRVGAILLAARSDGEAVPRIRFMLVGIRNGVWGRGGRGPGAAR